MKALVGDHLEVRGAHVAEGGRQGEAVEVQEGADQEPAYLVRGPDRHEGTSFPGLARPHTIRRPAAKTGRLK